MYSLHPNIKGSCFQNLNFVLTLPKQLFMIRNPLTSHLDLMYDTTEELSLIFPTCQENLYRPDIVLHVQIHLSRTIHFTKWLKIF